MSRVTWQDIMEQFIGLVEEPSPTKKPAAWGLA